MKILCIRIECRQGQHMQGNEQLLANSHAETDPVPHHAIRYFRLRF